MGVISALSFLLITFPFYVFLVWEVTKITFQFSLVSLCCYQNEIIFVQSLMTSSINTYYYANVFWSIQILNSNFLDFLFFILIKYTHTHTDVGNIEKKSFYISGVLSRGTPNSI